MFQGAVSKLSRQSNSGSSSSSTRWLLDPVCTQTAQISSHEENVDAALGFSDSSARLLAARALAAACETAAVQARVGHHDDGVNGPDRAGYRTAGDLDLAVAAAMVGWHRYYRDGRGRHAHAAGWWYAALPYGII